MGKGFYSGVLVPVVSQYKFASALRLEINGAIWGWLAYCGLTSQSLVVNLVSMGFMLLGFYFSGLRWDDKAYFRKSNEAAFIIGFTATFASGTNLFLGWNLAVTVALTMFVATSTVWLGVQHSK